MSTLANQLQERFQTKQFSLRSLRRMMQFAEEFPSLEIIAGKDDAQIQKELAELRNNDVMTPDLVFKSPYFLDFTGLKGYYSEHDLEDMLITGLQQFIMELGNGFTFVERQKRMIIDGEDFYLDLLFYHRKLHRLIAIELKKGKFKAAYKGQMEHLPTAKALWP